MLMSVVSGVQVNAVWAVAWLLFWFVSCVVVVTVAVFWTDWAQTDLAGAETPITNWRLELPARVPREHVIVLPFWVHPAGTDVIVSGAGTVSLMTTFAAGLAVLFVTVSV